MGFSLMEDFWEHKVRVRRCEGREGAKGERNWDCAGEIGKGYDGADEDCVFIVVVSGLEIR